ncbi:hypothetical protein B5G10_01775 [Barnesiella sp. An55]|nr:hypothetical protein B5G10_01775 [Barnesiella sp. An55]
MHLLFSMKAGRRRIGAFYTRFHPERTKRIAFCFFKKKMITYLIVKEMKWKILCIFAAKKVKK